MVMYAEIETWQPIIGPPTASLRTPPSVIEPIHFVLFFILAASIISVKN